MDITLGGMLAGELAKVKARNREESADGICLGFGSCGKRVPEAYITS
jgi:hypothetical protein